MASNPGFSPLDWHDFRLMIGPDASLGGQISASLYLDDDLTNPILTQLLDPTLIDEIRFGDQTSTNNGIFDVDYLRFAETLAADFNLDGLVNSADLPMWESGFGIAKCIFLLGKRVFWGSKNNFS